MNTYNVNDQSFINSDLYREFMIENPAKGSLRVRAYSASGAIPVEGLKITVSTEFKGNNIVFYEGSTNESGITEKITLPTPRLRTDNLDVPAQRTYLINAAYLSNNASGIYEVKMYEGVCVIQNINIVPGMLQRNGERYGH